jgi:hypothetical protein
MVDRRECGECQEILADFEAALSEIRVSPTLSKQLREDAGLLLTLGTGEGADEAIGQFPFQMPQLPPKYPKFAAALSRMAQHKIDTGHTPLFGG